MFARRSRPLLRNRQAYENMTLYTASGTKGPLPAFYFQVLLGEVAQFALPEVC